MIELYAVGIQNVVLDDSKMEDIEDEESDQGNFVITVLRNVEVELELAENIEPVFFVTVAKIG